MHNISNILYRLDLEVKRNEREDKALQILQNSKHEKNKPKANLAFTKLMSSCYYFPESPPRN